jgi:hypothetical protein
MFLPAYHRGLSCDAFLVDGSERARTLRLDGDAPEASVVDALLGRVVLMSRSLYDVRRHTFGLFCARRDGRFVLAQAPDDPAVLSSLEEALGEFGRVERGPPEPLVGFAPLLAYVSGCVSFLRGPDTRAFERLAARRGLPIAAAVWSHEASDVEIR